MSNSSFICSMFEQGGLSVLKGMNILKELSISTLSTQSIEMSLNVESQCNQATSFQATSF